MTDNELLARWLGKLFVLNQWVIPKPPEDVSYWNLPSIEEIRTSNEWAGVLLDKMVSDGNFSHFYCDVPGSCYMHIFKAGAKDSFWTKPTPTWRDAVVDAALEIARRERA